MQRVKILTISVFGKIFTQFVNLLYFSATGLDPLNIVAKLKQTVNEKKKAPDDVTNKKDEIANHNEEIRKFIRKYFINYYLNNIN